MITASQLLEDMELMRESLRDWSGTWSHYTDVNKIGINPKQFHQDPAGVYLFPQEFKPEGSLWANKKFLYTVKIKPSAKIFDIGAASKKEKMDFASALGVEVSQKDLSDNRDYWEEFKNKYILQRSAPGAARWAKDIMKLGYDAIFDDKKTLHVAEVQLLVLNIRVIKVIDVVERSGRKGVYKKVGDHQKLVAQYLKKWDVKIKKIKTKKGLYGEPNYLAGRVYAKKDGEFLDWEISIENNQMMRLSIVDSSKRPSNYSLGSLVKTYSKKEIENAVTTAANYVMTEK